MGATAPPVAMKIQLWRPSLAMKAPLFLTQMNTFFVIRSECGETYKLRRYSVEKPGNFFEKKIRLKSLLVLRTRGNHPTSRKSANDITASNPLRQNRSFVVTFLVPSQKLKWMLKYCSYMKFFLINQLQRYPSRVVYMFRQISYLGPKLRAFSGKENMTFFENSYKLLE